MNMNGTLNMVARRIPWLAVRGAMAAIVLGSGTTQAGVALQPGTMIEFATVPQGRSVLGTRDDFIQMMSQFDRCVRMKTSAAVTEGQFLAYIQNQVQTWSAAEQTKLSNIVASIRTPLANLNLSLPATIRLIKTTGSEEANATYVRGTSIILPQVMVSGDSDQLMRILTHELFHVYTYYNPHVRETLFGILGFRLGNEIPFPPWLMARRIASPNPTPWDFAIRVKVQGKSVPEVQGETVPEVQGETVPAMPVYYSKATNYTGGDLFSYLLSKLLVLEETPTGLRPRLKDAGEPILLSPYTEDFREQIGWNTSYNIHPEETLAENFMQVVLGTKDVYSPRVHHLLRRAIQAGSSVPPCFLAGRFTANLVVESGQTQVLESSTDLVDWCMWDCFTNTAGVLEVCDPTAWLGGNRFFRARTAEIVSLEPGDTNNLVWIPPGTFLMGSPTREAGRQSDEGPQRLVTLTRGFWLGKFEVTQGEYQQVMGTNPSSFAGVWSRPVEKVTWDEAAAYCAQLTQREQTAGRLPSGQAYRLPTEAEWEYAARAGTTNRFSFGDDLDYVECYGLFWFFDNANGHTHPVGIRPSNAWGLYDMHGNVEEWCQDWYGAYSGSAVTNPPGPTIGEWRIVRGGSWFTGPCRSAARNYTSSTVGYPQVGLRVVLAPTGP